MAKIYETEKDVKREELQKKIVETRNAKEHGWLGALSMACIGLFKSEQIDADKLLTELNKSSKPSFFKKADKVVMWVSGIVAVVSAALWLKAGSNEKKLQSELNMLGPEDVIAPPCAGDYLKTKTSHAARISSEQAAAQVQQILSK